MNIQTLLAMHASAVLLKKKPSALFSAPKLSFSAEELAQAVGYHGLAHAVLCDRCAHALVLVYNPAQLTDYLGQITVREALGRIDYPVDADLWTMLAHLQARIQSEVDFPHEIGFFLGYPPEDVLGFMRYRGKHCKHCGLWKVYSDVPRAKAMFAEYHACRRQVLTHLGNGGSLFDLPAGLAG